MGLIGLSELTLGKAPFVGRAAGGKHSRAYVGGAR